MMTHEVLMGFYLEVHWVNLITFVVCRNEWDFGGGVSRRADGGLSYDF